MGLGVCVEVGGRMGVWRWVGRIGGGGGGVHKEQKSSQKASTKGQKSRQRSALCDALDCQTSLLERQTIEMVENLSHQKIGERIQVLIDQLSLS